MNIPMTTPAEDGDLPHALGSAREKGRHTS